MFSVVPYIKRKNTTTKKGEHMQKKGLCCTAVRKGNKKGKKEKKEKKMALDDGPALVDEGEEDITLPGPFVAKELDELGLTLSGPLNHLGSTTNVEKNTSGSEASKNVEANPGHDLTEIVGTGNVLKETTVGNNKVIATRTTHVLELHMANKVENHKNAEPGESKIQVPWGKIVVSGNVNIVSNSSSETPVVKTILEKIEHRHGKSTKLMNKNSFKKTLGIMSHPKEESKLLIGVKRIHSLVSINGKNSKCKENINSPWTNILKDVYRTECNLWSKILINNFNFIRKRIYILHVLRKRSNIIQHDRLITTSDFQLLTARLGIL